jgi:PPM family protein phosphatase
MNILGVEFSLRALRKITMSNNEFTGFAAKHIGASKTRSYEDRGFFGDLTTSSGLTFTVAIVADGVGGGNLGQRAAELTIATIKKSIQSTNRTDSEIPQIMGEAIGKANKSVFEEARNERHKKQGMSSTVSIAIVYKQKLFIANVGDSRVYLVRNDKAKQITIDHTFANEKIRSGVLTPQKAYAHPKADFISRSIGFEPKVVVDLGLYLKSNEDGKQAFSNQGLKLEKNDVILVCSDGLIKERLENPNQHYVENNEIVDTIKQYNAEEAAKVMVDIAVGRNVDDNVTAVVVELSGRKVSSVNRKKAIMWSGFSALLLIILLFISKKLVGVSEVLNDIEQAGTYQAETSTAVAQTVAAYTPTPLPTQRPPLELDEIGAIINAEGNRQIFKAGDLITVQDFSEVHVNHTGEFEDGKIYLLGLSEILFEAEPFNEMNFVIFPNSELFIYPGRYTEGAGARIAGAKGTVDFSVSGSCMALNYDGDQVTASCYEGNCNYQINYGNFVTIPLGQQVVLDINTLLPQTAVMIPLEQVYAWAKVLPRDTHARKCVKTWIPTPVPTKKHGGGEDNGTQVP